MAIAKYKVPARRHFENGQTSSKEVLQDFRLYTKSFERPWKARWRRSSWVLRETKRTTPDKANAVLRSFQDWT